MKVNKLTGRVLFGNILKPKSYDLGQGKFVEDPHGSYQLTLVVDENHKDYLAFMEAVNQKKDEIKSSDKYKKLQNVVFSMKDKPHTEKDGTVVQGKRQITLKRNAVNKNNDNVSIDIYDKFNQPYRPENEIGFGSEVQVAFMVGDTYIQKDNTWYLTLYLLAVMIEKEASSSYGFEVHATDVAETVAREMDGEIIDEEKLPF